MEEACHHGAFCVRGAWRQPVRRLFNCVRLARSTRSRARTRWIGDDSIKEPTTSPGVTCDVEGAEVYDPLRNPVFSSRADDTRSLSFGTNNRLSGHGSRVDQRPGRNLFRAFVDRQCQTRTRVLQNMPSSGHDVESCACSCSHASTTHVSHASGSDEGIIHELSWCGLPQ